jgi:hypothetical protein
MPRTAPTAPRPSSGRATAQPPRAGPLTPTARCESTGIRCAWTSWVATPGWARRSPSSTATPPPTRTGSPGTGTCAARIFDCVADRCLRQQPGRGDGWLAGCCLRSSACRFASDPAWASWCSVRTRRRMPSCWCSGTRTRCCAATPARAGTGPAGRRGFAALAPLLSRRRCTEIFPVTPAALRARLPRAGREQARPGRAAQARPPAGGPGHRPPCYSPRERRTRRGDTAGSMANGRHPA